MMIRFERSLLDMKPNINGKWVPYSETLNTKKEHLQECKMLHAEYSKHLEDLRQSSSESKKAIAEYKHTIVTQAALIKDCTSENVLLKKRGNVLLAYYCITLAIVLYFSNWSFL